MTGVVSTLKVDADKCKQVLSEGMLATDVAYYLVRQNVSSTRYGVMSAQPCSPWV